MIFKAGIASIVLLFSAYLANLMWSDKNDSLLNLSANKANLVLFTVDTLRADHLSIYGYNRNTSPNLASIVNDSVIFDNAYTVSTYSAPAHASLLTGLYPSQLGINNNELEIPYNIETLAEILQQNGYATAAFVGDVVLGEDGKFNQGFAEFSLDGIHADTTVSITKSWAERGWTKAQGWLEKWLKKKHSLAKHQQQPFFLWFHANHPHGNYSPPSPYQNLFIKQAPAEVQLLQTESTFSLDSYFRKHIETGKISQDLINWVTAQYDGEIAFSDYLFGQLIDFLKASNEYDNTHIIFIADHGEVLFEHWRPGKIRSAGHHANLYYQPVLKVPLLIKPAIVKQNTVKSSTVKPETADPIVKGQHITSLVSSVDIFNTALDLLSLKVSTASYSQSLMPLLMDPKISHRSQVFFSGQAYNNFCSGLIDNEWHLVRCQMQDQKKQTLFHLPEDPLQLVNVVQQQQEQVSLLEKKLNSWLNNLQQQPATSKNNKFSEQMRKHLEESGYLDKRENL